MFLQLKREPRRCPPGITTVRVRRKASRGSKLNQLTKALIANSLKNIKAPSAMWTPISLRIRSVKVLTGRPAKVQRSWRRIVNSIPPSPAKAADLVKFQLFTSNNQKKITASSVKAPAVTRRYLTRARLLKGCIRNLNKLSLIHI